MEPAWQDGVYLNIVFCPGHCKALGQLHDSPLAGTIGQHMAPTKQRKHRAIVDDLAPTSLYHGSIDCLRAQKSAAQVGIEDSMPFRCTQLLREFADVRTSVVHQDVDTAKGVQGLLSHGAYRRFLTDIHA